jgi:AhpD family alkylhydroperoxidase
MGVAVKKSEVFPEIEKMLGKVPDWMRKFPEQALPGFWTLFRDLYMGDTKIPGKYKDLIGLGVAAATRCKYCTLFHTEAARLNGATDAEISEANSMASFTMMTSTFINAEQIDYEKFKTETMDIVSYLRKNMPPEKARGERAHA